MNHLKTVLIILISATLASAISGCGKGGGGSKSSDMQNEPAGLAGMSGMQETESPDETLYQCSMHPNVVSDKPGQCPICAMDLQPVQSIDAKGIVGRAPVRLTGQQRQLINIRVSPVVSDRAIKQMTAAGIIHHDSSKVFTISAWTSGRIEKLVVNKEEAFVEEGDVLYEIYSPDLYAAMQEYVGLLQGPLKRDSLVESARVRLLQIGLKNDQIDELAQKGAAPLTIPIQSPSRGIVMTKMIREGQYVKEGDALYSIVDLSELWLIAEVYEADLPFVSPGQQVAATTPAVPGETFRGTIELVNHHIDPKTRTAKLRIIFSNPQQTFHKSQDGSHHGHRLLPDMWMSARIEKDLGQQLSIPRSALFDTGRRQYVFVETEEGLFVPKEIEPGPRIDNKILVNAGLEEGELVVTDGLFLLDSESLLKASAGGDSETDDPPEDGMQSGSRGKPSGLPEAVAEPLGNLWNAYLNLRASLANDSDENLRQPYEEIRRFAEVLKQPGFLPAVGKNAYLDALDQVRTDAVLEEGASIQAARVQFGHLSNSLIAWANDIPEIVTQDLHVASCPMWTDSPGQWLQTEEQVNNPFMGAAMLQCGSIESVLPKGGRR